MFFTFQSFILLFCFLLFFKVASFYLVIYYFEVLGLLNVMIFFLIKRKKCILNYLLISFVVIEGAVGFCFLVVYSRSFGRDQIARF